MCSLSMLLPRSSVADEQRPGDPAAVKLHERKPLDGLFESEQRSETELIELLRGNSFRWVCNRRFPDFKQLSTPHCLVALVS